MDIDAVPDALKERLGAEATGGLLQLLGHAHREWRADVIAVCAERFERRLVEEVSAVRVQMAGGESSRRQDIPALGAALRQEMAAMRADLRQEMAAMRANLRQEMAAMRADLRQEMAEMRADLRQDIANTRFELLKWCFLFWVGQVVTMTGIIAVMLRVFRG